VRGGWRKGQPFLPPTVLYIARVLKHAVDPRIVLKQILVFPTRQVASLWLRSLPDWCPNALGPFMLAWALHCTLVPLHVVHLKQRMPASEKFMQ